jgi:site-specific recombinase XerD
MSPFYNLSSKILPNFVTQEEFEKIFEEMIRQEKKATIKRKLRLKQYRLAVLLGFEAGLRISEIVGWPISHIPKLQVENVSEVSIKIFGKGGRERVVPRPKRFSDKALEMLPLKISRRALQTYITKLGKDVLNRDIGFHTLRHGFGSHLAGQGRPLHEIQMLMGHARLDTTGIYMHANPKVAIEKAREVF